MNYESNVRFNGVYKVYTVLTHMWVWLIDRCHESWVVMTHVWMTMLKHFTINQMFRRLCMPVMGKISGIGAFASTFMFTFFWPC